MESPDGGAAVCAATPSAQAGSRPRWTRPTRHEASTRTRTSPAGSRWGVSRHPKTSPVPSSFYMADDPKKKKLDAKRRSKQPHELAFMRRDDGVLALEPLRLPDMANAIRIDHHLGVWAYVYTIAYRPDLAKAEIKAAVHDDATLNDGGPCVDAACVTTHTRAGATCGSCWGIRWAACRPGCGVRSIPSSWMASCRWRASRSTTTVVLPASRRSMKSIRSKL